MSTKPDTVLVDDSGYFSKKQQQKLANAKISVTVVPDLSSDTRIKAAVSVIGTMLDSATGGESKKRADEYLKYHDALLKDIMGSNGYGSHLDRARRPVDLGHIVDARAHDGIDLCLRRDITVVGCKRQEPLWHV